jgi:hypothetical protein
LGLHPGIGERSLLRQIEVPSLKSLPDKSLGMYYRGMVLYPLILFNKKKNNIDSTCAILSKNNSKPRVFSLKGHKLIKKCEINTKNLTAKSY